MKRIMAALIVVLVTLEASPQVDNLTIEGRVLRKSTSGALDGVLVLLSGSEDAAAATPVSSANLATQIQILRVRMSQSPGSNMDDPVRNVLRAAGSSAASAMFAFTDGGGRFSFRNLSPGSYTLRVARDGFFGPKRNGTYQPAFVKTIELQASSPPAWVEVGLAEGVVIVGTLRNMRPGVRTPITAYRTIYVNGRERWTREFVVNAGPRGDFKMQWLPPGEWYIGVPGSFYKDVTDAALATKIVAKEGETVAIELNTPPGVDSSRRVSGSAMNPYGLPNSVGVVDFSVSTFLVVPREPGLADEPYLRFTNSLPAGGLTGGRRANGEFEIGPVAPGIYDLISYFVEPTTRRTLIGRAPLQVGGSNVTGIPATIQPGVTLAGEVRVNGAGAELVNPGSFSLVLESLGAVPTDFVTNPNPIGLDASGRFIAYNMPQERYRMHVGHLPPAAYVADIRQGNVSVFDDGFDLTGNTGEFQIVIQTQGQTVSGTVRSADGTPAEAATVVLVPPEAKRRNPMHYRVINTDANGAFKIQDVPPGEYTVFAWENILLTAWMNPKVLEKYERRGRSISLTLGISLDLQLPLIPDAN
jgi:hypothetical protein